MPNDINGINSGKSQHAHERRVQDLRQEKSPAADDQNRTSGLADKVSVSDMASRLKSLEDKLSTQPEIDQDRVQQIRDALNSGEFKVDPERVANKIVDFESDFKNR
jgi:negative regulator of flagellin synthesis FlgM